MSRKKVPSRLLTDAVREVRNTRSRFLSLLVLSALAVCFLAGLRATAPDMKETGDLYFDQQRLMDLRVVSTLGLTEEDVELLARQEGVEEAEGAYTIDAAVPLKDQEMIVKVHSFAEEGSNRPRLVEGRLPRKAGECLVEPLFLEKSGLSIGDTIRLDTGTGDFEDALARREFTIVGTADSPLYISVERGSSSLGTGAVSAFVLLPQAAFSLDYYTDAYLRAEGAEELLCYSEDYTELVNSLSDALEPLAEERSALRGESIREEAEQALADARRELSDGEAEVSQELSEGEAELTDARRELDDGWAEYYDGLNTFEQETADAQREIDDGEAELADALTELRDGEQEYQDALPELEDARREVADARQELADARAELDDGWAEYRKGYAKYEYGLAAYTEGMAQYEQGLAGVEQMRAGAQQARQGAAQAQQGAVQAQQGAAQAGAAAQQYAAQAQQAAAMGNLLLAQQLQAQAQQYEAQAQQLTAQAQQLQAQAAQALAQAEALEVQAVQVEAQLSAGLPRLQSSALELNASLGLLTQAKRELDDGEAEYADGAARLADGEQGLADGERELADARQELDEGWQEYRDGQAELADARETLERESADGRAELADALTELQNGEAEYADGLADYEEGKAEAEQELADARKELEQARRDLDALEDCSWYLLGRGTNTGYASYEMDADRMGSLAAVFPLIFFLVAALVCLTTMTRMVEEQRITIGGMKALGYSKGAIAVKYVGYGFLASAAGAALGLAVGLTLLPWIICNAWAILYTVGEIQYGFYPATSLLACGAAVGTVTLSALAACFSTLAAVPAELMRPKAPPMGKRILLERIAPLWRRLSFNYKITLRNLFRYQRRFWMTVVGIGGCAALIVTAFGLRGSIFDVMDRQYDEIYRYTAQIGLVDRVTPGELAEVTGALERSELVSGWLVSRSETASAETERYTVDCTVEVVPSQEALAPFVSLRHRTDSVPVLLPDDGVVLTEKLASLLGVSAGDTFTLDGDSRVQVRVADVTEHYIMHYVYMTDAYYQTLYGQPPDENQVLAAYPAEGAEALDAELVGLDGVTTLSQVAATREVFTSSLESVDYAVVLIIVCAAALAFVVLYNLTNINITERMRELATLKVLGFYDGELSAYIYRENVILTVFGVALGMGMGKLLHQWLVLTVEIDLLMFGRTLALSSYLYAGVLTAVFSLVVNLAAHRKLKKLDMVESLKTVE